MRNLYKRGRRNGPIISRKVSQTEESSYVRDLGPVSVIGPAYGTTKAAWRGVLDEADSLSELHLRVRDRLHEETYVTIKGWSKDHYHKNAFGGIKECKEAEEAFKKVSLHWRWK